MMKPSMGVPSGLLNWTLTFSPRASSSSNALLVKGQLSQLALGIQEELCRLLWLSDQGGDLTVGSEIESRYHTGA